MNNVRTTRSISAGEPMSVDRSLLEYLKPKVGERYSRIEAYCDLLSRAANSPYTAKCAGQQIELLPGQCVITVSDLARKWQWQRATVRQFLDGLVALGLLEMKPFVKSYVFTVKQHSMLSLQVCDTDDVLNFCNLLFARYLLGRASLEEVADSYGKYYGMMADHAGGQSKTDTATKAVFKHQTALFRHLMSLIAVRLADTHEVPAALADTARLLFGRDRLWNWQDVMADIGILASAFNAQVKPSQLAEARAVHGEAELTLLDGIHEYCTTVFSAIASIDGNEASPTTHDEPQEARHKGISDNSARTSGTVPKTSGASSKDEVPTSVGSAG